MNTLTPILAATLTTERQRRAATARRARAIARAGRAGTPRPLRLLRRAASANAAASPR
jgi:hypothetical protein